jgi:hypothetical protein
MQTESILVLHANQWKDHNMESAYVKIYKKTMEEIRRLAI